MIERDMSEPVRMMGEFMQPGGRLMLAKLGLQGLSPLHLHLRAYIIYILSLCFLIKIMRLYI